MSLLGEGSAGTGQPENPAPEAGNPSGGSEGQGGQTSWRDSLPEDIRKHPSIASFQDLPSFAKSYIHAQSMVGKKGVMVPGEKATPEEWDGFFKSIGRPELDKYELKPTKEGVSEDFLSKYKELAHKSGLLPKQAQEIMDFYIQSEEAAIAAKREADEKLGAESVAALKQEWGQGFDKHVALARNAVNELGGAGFKDYLNKTGLGNHPEMIKIMAKVGSLLGEDKIRGQTGGNVGQTPQEIQAEINRIMGDPKHAYNDPSRPDHRDAVNAVEELFRRMSG